MTAAEIALVVILTSAFILLSFFTKRIKPKAEHKEQPKFLRIFIFTVAVLFLALIWVGAPDANFYVKALLSIFPINPIYNNLKAWLFRPKEQSL